MNVRTSGIKDIWKEWGCFVTICIVWRVLAVIFRTGGTLDINGMKLVRYNGRNISDLSLEL